jgi:glycosyltransferase involved in cell wall biosynthesis
LIGEDRGISGAILDEARRLGVAERIAFLGRRDDVPELLSAMDIGVMASHEEGSSNALLEKLAAGLPVVATDVGGNPEALYGMPGCELVQPMDPAGLTRGIKAVIDRLDTSGSQQKERCRLVRERFSVDAMVDAYERLYLSKMAGGTHQYP